jgi:hypothetical protein
LRTSSMILFMETITHTFLCFLLPGLFAWH